MKTIYLIRHANSNYLKGCNDFDRPINKESYGDINQISGLLLQNNFNPDLFISSPSKRTTETVMQLCDCLNYPFGKVIFNPSIYDANIDVYIQLTNLLSDTLRSIAIVGHNPGISQFANYLTNNFNNQITPCGIISIKLEIDNWNELVSGMGTIEYFLYPIRN